MYVYMESLFPSLIGRFLCPCIFRRSLLILVAVVPGREPWPQSFEQRAVLCIWHFVMVMNCAGSWLKIRWCDIKTVWGQCDCCAGLSMSIL